MPFVLFNHSHGGSFSIGKEELRSSSHYLQPESFLETLIAVLYAGGAIDIFEFCERKHVEITLF